MIALKKIFLLVLVAFLMNAALSATEKSNVLIIAVDDMNDWIGPLKGLGNLPITPNLDRLAIMSGVRHPGQER
jgi:hypothetical protein